MALGLLDTDARGKNVSSDQRSPQLQRESNCCIAPSNRPLFPPFCGRPNLATQKFAARAAVEAAVAAMGPVYHTTQQLLTLIAGLGSNCSAPYFTETRNETVDGLKIMSVVVGAEHANKAAAPEKLRVMLTFGAHGREYFASEVAYKFLSTLCDGSDRSTNILNDVAFAIIPVFNPSGRTRTDSADAKGVRTTFLSEQQCTDRRKNGNLVDINRNFDVSWSMSDGSSGYEGDDDYRGPSAMSEVEPNTANKLRADWQPDMCAT